MANIGGNVAATLQTKTIVKNEIGEDVPTWQTVKELWGWLDYLGGTSKHGTYNAKLQESTHVFLMDYEPITDNEAEARLLVNGKTYHVEMIDNPMELNEQIEIYLSYTGA